MKKILKVVLILMSVASLLNLAACQSRDEKAENVILSALQEKYGEEFEIDSIGGSWGTINNNTIKAICYPQNSSDRKFKVEVMKDMSKVFDEYPLVLIGERVDEYLKNTMKDDFGEIYSKTRIDVLALPGSINKDTTFEEFYKEYDSSATSIHIYIDCDKEIDKNAEVEKLYGLSNKLTEKMQEAFITFVYLKSEYFVKAKEEDQKYVDNRNGVNSYNIDKSKMYGKTSFEIDEWKVISDKDEMLGKLLR